MKVLDSRIAGSATGIDAAATTIANTTIDDVDEGIRSRSLDLVEVDDATVSALSVGINVAPGSPVQLAGSHIDALEAIHGTLSQDGINQLSLPPLNLFGAIGVPLDPARPAPGTNTSLPAARHRQPRTADAPHLASPHRRAPLAFALVPQLMGRGAGARCRCWSVRAQVAGPPHPRPARSPRADQPGPW